ncbi:unnamed protein product [Rotaria sp. Silwood1]|nr:unnamed protein product [Rotaria sp. Silwood1]CAF1638528.1 unnamed protein product [Rotaria sp. Silwood1]CAF1638564.1 unnamed protein product [Rotaria sp. Silwood1]CAF4981646.1 unnamed protein product [Rotaria sp. Silwood1]CAF5106367.1 unnamed protein product [Rotaria sp. Silwood1]
MTLRDKTASRFLLSAARIVLTDAEFTRDYLSNFRGNTANRVPIPQESVDLLQRAVRQRFGFKEEDMGSIWASIRTSLVQRVTDIHPISLSEDNHDLVSVATNNQTEVNRIQNKNKYIGIAKLYQSEKICGVCYHSSTHGICSTIDCTHEAMEIPSDDVVEIVSFDLAEQSKILIDKNIDLLQKCQNEARTQTTSDANDVVRGDVYQSILNVYKDFFVSVMIHSDGIPLYKSKNCNAWPILGAVLKLPPYSRTRDDNTLILSLWIGKQKPNFNIIFEKLSK